MASCALSDYYRPEQSFSDILTYVTAGNTELVGLLLDQGAIVTASDHHGSTPLHLACQKGHQRTVVRPLRTPV